eukprot:5076778-Pleurochrysis_carterae.AAC.1
MAWHAGKRGASSRGPILLHPNAIKYVRMLVCMGKFIKRLYFRQQVRRYMYRIPHRTLKRAELAR